MHSADYSVARYLSLSVCQSVTRQYSVETAQNTISVLTIEYPPL